MPIEPPENANFIRFGRRLARVQSSLGLTESSQLISGYFSEKLLSPIIVKAARSACLPPRSVRIVRSHGHFKIKNSNANRPEIEGNLT